MNEQEQVEKGKTNMKRKTIAGTTVMVTIHNEREQRLSNIIERLLVRTFERNTEDWRVEMILEDVKGLLEAAYYLRMIEAPVSFSESADRSAIYYRMNGIKYAIEKVNEYEIAQ